MIFCVLFGHKPVRMPTHDGAIMTWGFTLPDGEHMTKIVMEGCARCHLMFWRTPSEVDPLNVLGGE